jgi:hypothetical protein
VDVRFGTGDGFFVPSAHYDIGGAASTIAIGDFNGDGIPDLVTGNGYSTLRPTSLSVLLGNGNGTFRRPVYSPLPGVATSLAVADFNGDGTSDVAAALLFTNTVTVSLGNGDGTLGAPLSLAVNRNPYTLVAADFNGDGFPDLASANLGTGTVSVLLNDTNWGVGPGSAGRARHGSAVAQDEFRQGGVLDPVAAAGWRPASPGLPTISAPTAGVPFPEAMARPLAEDVDRLFAVAAREGGSFGLPRVVDFQGDGRPDPAAADWLSDTASVGVAFSLASLEADGHAHPTRR